MVALRASTKNDIPRVMAIWRDAVDATHAFLRPADREQIDRELCAILPGQPLTLALDDDQRAIAFMLVHDGHLEALFVDPAFHGRGVGRALVEAALAAEPDLTVDVNEQNPGALAFYLRMGFVARGRSERDGQGRPYPLLHLGRHA